MRSDDNPRLLYTKLDAPMNRPTNEQLASHKLSVSSSTPLELNQSLSLPDGQVIGRVSKSKHLLPELYLLQAFLNQDFEWFSSDEDSEVFGEDNLLLVYSKKLVECQSLMLCLYGQVNKSTDVLVSDKFRFSRKHMRPFQLHPLPACSPQKVICLSN